MERAKEMIRSIVRLVQTILRIPESMENGHFVDFINFLKKEKLMQEQFD